MQEIKVKIIRNRLLPCSSTLTPAKLISSPGLEDRLKLNTMASKILSQPQRNSIDKLKSVRRDGNLLLWNTRELKRKGSKRVTNHLQEWKLRWLLRGWSISVSRHCSNALTLTKMGIYHLLPLIFLQFPQDFLRLWPHYSVSWRSWGSPKTLSKPPLISMNSWMLWAAFTTRYPIRRSTLFSTSVHPMILPRICKDLSQLESVHRNV